MNPTLFTQGLKALKLTAEENQIAQFSAYSALLKEWNENINLTAIVDDDGIAVKHFLDSILPLAHVELPQGACLADVGTGAGFPGLPLKLMRPDLQVTLIDSLQKRIRFLETVCDTVHLEGVTCVHGRAEELGKNRAYREQFDVLVSRAVANLKVLCEYCLPFVKVGGVFVALKAQELEEELAEAKAMIGSLGGRVEQIIEAPLPQSDIVRKLVLIRKVSPTPTQFPRRANKIKTGK
ncbi:MAG: 16S rRNA (guanine(527)-N(7))-methyltransferase RsmG [Clostridia bacterium]|nr:16S rRNA (guanine(527)-N(7))-methyltransferase RsmG [Clostridia bacterium]